MFKKIIFFLLTAFLFVFRAGVVRAIDRPHFISFVNPIRGSEEWRDPKQSPLDLPRFQYQLSSSYRYPVTWLLRFDAVENASISAYFEELSATDSSQTLGAFLEITPKLVNRAGVTYPPGEYYFAANRIFLSGYDQSDRLKLIDSYMNSFFDRFGFYPRVVGAWHIDAYSLEYLQKHYSVAAVVICDEQYTTDNYRFWGGYLGSPYFPSRLNFLEPARNRDDRVKLVITKWAQRDPGNFYGQRGESNFSTQVNDYTANGLTTKFFTSLIGEYSNGDFNEFTQTNIGLENDYNFAQYKNEIIASFAALKQAEKQDNLRFISLTDFASWMGSRYSFTNPAFFFQTDDLTGRTTDKTYWYQNPFYRIGLKSSQGKTFILDFRLYNPKDAEIYYQVRNIDRHLYAETDPLIDSVKYPGSQVEIDIDLKQATVSYSNWQVIFRQGDKELRLKPTDIIFSNFAAPILNTEEIKVQKGNTVTTWHLAAKLPFTDQKSVVVIVSLLLLSCLSFLIWKMKSFRLLYLTGLLLGSLTLLTMLRSGLVYLYGYGLWGPNGHDAIFHLSLDNHFAQLPLSLANPQIYSEKLMNYHFGFDWLTGLLTKLTQLSLSDLYFRILPVILVFFLVYAIIKLLLLWRYSRLEILISLALVFLAGSAGFIANIIWGRNPFGGESLFWANQSVSLLLNPPFAFSLIGLIIFLYFLEKHPHRLSPKEFLLLSLLGGVLVQIKIYAFILLCLALLLRRRFKLFLGVGIAGAVFILPSLGLSGSPFAFNPLWFPRSMIESFDRLYSPTLARAWQVYENNGVFLKLILVNFLAIAVFYAGNLYLRLVGLYRVLFGKDFNLTQNISRLIIIFGLIIPLLFTQKVNPWNTIQFLYYSLFFLGLFTAKQLVEWLHNLHSRFLLILFSVLFIAAASVTSVGTLADYLTAQSASRVSLTELRALDLLRRSDPGTVVSPLTYSRNLPVQPDPRSLYVYTSTAYISALSGQPEYLSDTINLDITGYSYQERAKNVQRLYLTRDAGWVKQFMSANNLTYIYETPYDRLQVRREDTCLTKIFDSGEINIYKYSCHD